MIKYLSSTETQGDITLCGLHFGVLQGILKHAFGAMKETDERRKLTDKLGPSSIELPEAECTENSEALVMYRCALDAESTIFDKLYGAAQLTFQFLKTKSIIDESDFDMVRNIELEDHDFMVDDYYLYQNNYLATLEYLRSAIVLCNRLRIRQGPWPPESFDRPLPHNDERLPLYLEEAGIEKTDVVQRFAYASAWLQLIPCWPNPIEDKRGRPRAEIFIALLSNFMDGSSTCSYQNSHLTPEDQEWLIEILEERGWQITEYKHYTEHLEITMPNLVV